MFDMGELLRQAVSKEASDIHLVVGQPPVFRKSGQLIMGWEAPVTEEDMNDIVEHVMPAHVRSRFEENHEVDFPVYDDELGRFRANLYMSQGAPVLALRLIRGEVPTFEGLDLPPTLADVAQRPSGIFIICGPAGTGKSTTLARMVQHINENESRRIITLEDPIEFIFKNRFSLISQREVGVDCLSFHDALRHVLRQDPDVIVIGEMRDAESISTAMSLAETGHLVFSTLHADNCSQAINRILNFFPVDERDVMRINLSGNLIGILAQRLLPAIGGGLVPAIELLLDTPVVRKIIQEGTLEKLHTALETDPESGMRSFNQWLLDLIETEKIHEDDALACSSNPEALVMALEGIDLKSDHRIMSE